MIFFIILSFTVLGMIAGGLYMYFIYVKARRPKEKGHEFVYIEKNGVVRELNADEEFLFERTFYPGDPLMPYIKHNYAELNADGNQAGFIMRHKIPANISIRKKDHTSFNPN
jgi:hypothetical protein